MLYKKIIGEAKVHSDLENVEKQIESLKSEGNTIVFTNGCFDILHLGHIEYLLRASLMGDVMVVGVNSDDSIKGLKGSNRPIMNEEHRYHLMASLSFIDMVIPFNEETPYNVIKSVKPDVLVKGVGYKEEEIVGYDIVKEIGGVTTIVETNLPPSLYSTTSIIEKIKKL